MAEAVDVAVVGAGQAGLSLSHELSHAGLARLVLVLAGTDGLKHERFADEG